MSEIEDALRKVLKEWDEEKRRRRNVIIHNVVLLIVSWGLGFLIFAILMMIFVSLL